MAPSYPTDEKGRYVRIPTPLKRESKGKLFAFLARPWIFFKKAWGVLTYKWRWQIAMNIPYLAIFALDRTVPAVHKFDVALISSITSKIAIPAFITSWFGIG